MTDYQIAILCGDNSDIILKKKNSYKAKKADFRILVEWF